MRVPIVACVVATLAIGPVLSAADQAGFEPLKRYTVAASTTWAQPSISANRVFIKDVSSLALWTID